MQARARKHEVTHAAAAALGLRMHAPITGTEGLRMQEPCTASSVVAAAAALDRASASAASQSKCTRCNLCILASIDPDPFPSGCPYLQPGEGRPFEPADIEDLLCAMMNEYRDCARVCERWAALLAGQST